MNNSGSFIEVKKIKERTNLRGKKYNNLVNLFHITPCDNDMKAIEQESSLELTEVRAGGINLESNIERDLESNPWRSGGGKDQVKKTGKYCLKKWEENQKNMVCWKSFSEFLKGKGPLAFTAFERVDIKNIYWNWQLACH